MEELKTGRGKWRFAVDRGGTFTDVIGLDPEGKYHILKLLSQSPKYEDASIEGIRRLLGITDSGTLPEDIIEGIRLGTTIATNALLERKGGRVALLITEGFSDLLEIGYQNRPDIFALCIRKPPLLYRHVIEVEERINAEGDVIKDLNRDRLINDLRSLRDREVNAISVVLLHSWKNPAHELICEEVLKEEGFRNVFLSHKSVNLIKAISRGQTTLLDAYLSTVLSMYIENIKRYTGSIRVEFIQSDGTLTMPDSFRGGRALLSGPAGGVIAGAKIAEEINTKGIITFDMGGTSTDVSRYDGDIPRRFDNLIDDIPVQTEMVEINTVAAGGGSILHFDGQKMLVGPDSAGSDPGPVCYGFGGPLTVTDANLLTGRIIPEYMPKTFGPDRKGGLDVDRTRDKFIELTSEINRTLNKSLAPEEVANGFLRIANEKMAMAIKEISISKGFDVRDYTLLCFGGAGGQHACAIARILGISTIVIHPLASVMSAYGIGLSKPAYKSARTVLMRYDEDSHIQLKEIFDEIENSIHDEYSLHGRSVSMRREIDLRPSGTESSITVRYRTFTETVNDFLYRYRKIYGFDPGRMEIEVVNVRIEISEEAEFFVPRIKDNKPSGTPSGLRPVCHHLVHFEEGKHHVPVYERDTIPAGVILKGPSMIVDGTTTIVIEPGFHARKAESGEIIIRRDSINTESIRISLSSPDPVLLEVFNNTFRGIASEMGYTLQNTASSVNIKERLDFSCAVFDSEGNLVANAPHIPVHIGAMADTVRAIIKENIHDMRPGDVYLTNNPYEGGSHLPDVTVICPVFADSERPIFFTAARGHHSDIGGITPGSIPPSASDINEEGVLIDNFLLVRDGRFREEELRKILADHPYPARNIDERIHDIMAQIAACNRGRDELLRLIGRYGLDTVLAYMGFIQDNAEFLVKRALLRFTGDDGLFESEFMDHLDDGSIIKLKTRIMAGENPPSTVSAVFDFSGTSPQHLNDNLNAPYSITHSAILYVLRCLIEENIPLNSGCMRPIRVILPEASILNPRYPAPVASGNVETSQRVVDVILGALRIAGASQGTMNNLLFQIEGDVPYYETIAGGAGATDVCDGASGVQVHMTNTRITDPEILEFKHRGVMIKQFRIRRGSGGKGRFRGGDGVIRELLFLRDAVVSIISERRVYQPYGMNGGSPGKKGENTLIRSDGSRVMLKHREVIRLSKGDSILIKTPGGGGFGRG